MSPSRGRLRLRGTQQSRRGGYRGLRSAFGKSRRIIRCAKRSHLAVADATVASVNQKVIRTPPNASNGAAGLKNRLLTPGPLVTPSRGTPGQPTPVGSLKMPQVAYWRLNRLLIEAKTSRCGRGLYDACRFTTV